MKSKWLGVVLLLATVSASAQQPPARFAGSADVTVIEVPVQVTKNSEPVRGLTKADFEVTDNGDPVPVVDFDVIDLSAPVAASQGLPVVARRHFLFLFDLAFSDPAAIGRAREAALGILRHSLHPSDLVGIASYRPTGLDLVLGFTSDHAQAALAIERVGTAAQFNRGSDPLGLSLASSLAELEGFFDSGSGSTLPGVLRMADGAEDGPRDMARMTTRGERDQEVDKIRDLTRALSELAGQLGALEGRKQVVYLSQGFSNRALVGEGTTAQDSISIERGATFQIDNDQRFGSSRAQNALEGMLEAFRRADCVIHTVDLSGARAGGDVRGNSAASGLAGNKDSLVAMARSTGGEIYDDFNDLGAAFGQLVERTRLTYLLTLQPPDVRPDGRYHRLRIRLTNGPRGVDLTHRPGYFAPDPKRSESPLARRFARAETILSGEDGGAIRASALALPFRLEGQPAYVPVVVEVDGKSLLAHTEDLVLDVTLYVYALADDGRVLDYFSQQVGLDLSKVRPAIEATGMKFFGHLDLPPGSHTLRVLVENEAAGSRSLASVAVEVPAASGEGPFVLPPVFPEPAGRWLVLREGEEQRQERVLPYPFFAGETPYLPEAEPRLSQAEFLDAQVITEGLGGAVTVAATLRDFATGTARPTPAPTLGEPQAGLGGSSHRSLRLPVRNLPPGRYVLELTVTDQRTGLQVQSSAAFEWTADS